MSIPTTKALLFVTLSVAVTCAQQPEESGSGIKINFERQAERLAARLALEGHSPLSIPFGFSELSSELSAKFEIPDGMSAEEQRDFVPLVELPPTETFFFDPEEHVCEPDTREGVADTVASPWSANCQLISTISGIHRSRGTGWLLGPRLVVTAGHNVHGGEDGNFFEKVEVIPAANGASRPFGEQISVSGQLRASAGWKMSGTLASDYGAILLDEPFVSSTGESPGVFTIAIMPDLALEDAEVFLSGYPTDKPFGEQWFGKSTLSAENIKPARLLYLLDTVGGQSGSALINVGETAVIGIHNYGGCPNKCTRITAAVKADLDAWLAESNAAP